MAARCTVDCGDVVDNRWRLERKLGRGSFGDVFAASLIDEDGPLVALKLEPIYKNPKRQVLRLEAEVFQQLNDNPAFPKFYEHGVDPELKLEYIVIEKCSANLLRVLQRRERNPYPEDATLRIGKEVVCALQAVHQLGYLHRDVKPSNILLRRMRQGKASTCLIDFGMARKFVDVHGKIKPQRRVSGMRGTTKYASINCHQEIDCSRRDDLWSLLYLLLELSLGDLPWAGMRDGAELLAAKLALHEDIKQNARKDLPAFCRPFVLHVESLGYADCPDYEYLSSLFSATFTGSTESPVHSSRSSPREDNPSEKKIEYVADVACVPERQPSGRCLLFRIPKPPTEPVPPHARTGRRFRRFKDR